MDFGTGRLEGPAPIQERPFSKSLEESKRQATRRQKHAAETAETEETAEELETHQFDDMA